MNKPTNFFWIGYYFGQNCILHPDTGKWILTGYFDGQVVCKKNIGTPDEDCMYYPISEISLVLRQINPFLFKSMQVFHWCIKSMAKLGYWVFEDKSVNVIYEI